MSNKTKNKSQTDQIAENITDAAQNAGVVLMTAAATVGLLEMPDHGNRIVLPMQPAVVQAAENSGADNQLRREREETAPHFISFSETQRTPSRSGKQ